MIAPETPRRRPGVGLPADGTRRLRAPYRPLFAIGALVVNFLLPGCGGDPVCSGESCGNSGETQSKRDATAEDAGTGKPSGTEPDGSVSSLGEEDGGADGKAPSDDDDAGSARDASALPGVSDAAIDGPDDAGDGAADAAAMPTLPPLCDGDAGATSGVECVQCNVDRDCGRGERCSAGMCECPLTPAQLANDVENCGACGQRCEVPFAGAVCVAGQCEVETCDIGRADCNGLAADGCEAPTAALGTPEMPVPLRPLSATYTGSLYVRSDDGASPTLTPTFTWTDVESQCGPIRYELLADDSCDVADLASCAFSSPEHVGVADSASYTPSAPLPVALEAPVGGLYAWRVRACDRASQCSEWTAPRSLHVGRVAADLDGDGYGDWSRVVASEDLQRATAQFGFGAADAPLSDTALLEVSWAYRDFGHFDANGDGFADVLVGRYDRTELLFYEPAALLGRKTMTDLIFSPMPRASARGGSWLVPLGDLNVDGLTDVAVVNHHGLGPTELVYTGRDGDSAVLSSFDSDSEPYYVMPAAIGDVDGDGRADTAVLANDGLRIVLGGSVRSAARLDTDLPMESCLPEIPFLESLEPEAWIWPAGDLDQEGTDDFVYGCLGLGYGVYLGGPGLQGAGVVFEQRDELIQHGLPPGDYDADGITELPVIRNGALEMVDLGAPDSPVTQPWTIPLRTDEPIQVTDVNGDGLPDLITDTSFALGGSQTVFGR